jgi:hypothetical protein
MTGKMMLVRWKGPFEFDEATQIEGPGLYLCWGRNRFGAPPAQDKLLYCGISEDERGIGKRIAAHKKDPYNHPDNHWWVGEVHLPAKSSRGHLEAAEWMVVRFTGTEHNRQKTVSTPAFDCYLINEWYTPEGEARHRHTGVAGAIPDVIGWNCIEQTIRFAASLQAPTSLQTWNGW